MNPHFEIVFEGEAWTDEDGPWRSLRLTLRDFVEEHHADLSNWSVQEYEAQWVRELNAIANSRDRGALITSIHDPSNAYRVWAWPMWRDGDNVHFQNRLLFMLEPKPGFDPFHVADYIGNHKLHSEDGELLSQWTVPIAEIRSFIDRQQNQSGEICSTPS